MTDSAQPEAQCPSCGSTEITTDKRYGAKLKISELARRVLRTPIFWIGIILVGIGLFYPGFQWRVALAYFGMVLMAIAVVNNQQAVGDGSDPLRYPRASHTCRQCGHQ